MGFKDLFIEHFREIAIRLPFEDKQKWIREKINLEQAKGKIL